MEQLEIYPHRRHAFETEQEKLKHAPISPEDKQLIYSFQEHLFSKGVQSVRVAKLTVQLRIALSLFTTELGITKQLSQLDKNDVVRFVSYINRQQDKSEATKGDYRRLVKQFYKWYKREDPRIDSELMEERVAARKFYEYIEHDIRASYKQEPVDPKTIIQESDVEQVISKGCMTAREKAFLSLLHETGARAGEFLNLRIDNITFKDSHAEIYIPCGKTGPRTIYIVRSVPHVLRYLETHPQKNDPKAALWASEARRNLNEPLQHAGGQQLINRCFEKADSSKKHNYHWFRHSRASLLAPTMTESLLCKYMGWRIGSREVKTYIHLCNTQLEDVYLASKGLKKIGEEQEQPVNCVCGTLNLHTDRYCFKCKRPLQVHVAIQDHELMNTEINKTIQFMMEMTKNPELMKRFEEFKLQLR